MFAVPRENAVSHPIWIVTHSSSRPSTCANGRNRYCKSATAIPIARIALTTPATMLSCVSTTPLGTPVVPDV
jgi:hypothetical protein